MVRFHQYFRTPSWRQSGALSLALLLLQAAGPTRAQQAAPPAEELTLEQLLNTPVTVASKSKQTARESPGIVTLITAEEIANSGARDLIDVLRMVPGFDFAVDVQGVVGAAVRGQWGYEGKILVLLDGQELNETLYSTMQFGNHLPVNLIERIEIIRGPGSVIYGGYAELAVINIISKGPAELKGGMAAFTYGKMARAYGRENAELGAGGQRGDWRYSLSGFAGQGHRSDGTYTDLNGASYSLAQDSRTDPRLLNASLGWRELQFRFIADRYHTIERDHYGATLLNGEALDFNGDFAEAAWHHDFTGGFSLTPRVRYKRQTAWLQNRVYDPSVLSYDKTAERWSGDLILNWAGGERFTGLGGVEFDRDHASNAADNAPGQEFSSGANHISYSNWAFFAQGTLKLAPVTLTAGARYERHSVFGGSFVPRLGLTWVREKFHLKALASQAFRTPGIENIRLAFGGTLVPEKTTSYEIETGYRVSETFFVTANVFDTTIRRPIIYFYDAATGGEGYKNFERTGTRGIEIEGRWRSGWGYAAAGYSYYRTVDNQVSLYAVPGDDRPLLGLAPHKLTASGSVKLGGGWRVNPGLVYYSARYGFVGDGAGNAVLRHFSASPLLSLFVANEDVFVRGLRLDLGVHDLGGENHRFIQPYNSGHAPLPGPTREYLIRLTYHCPS